MNPTFQHIALIGKHHTIGHSPSSTPHTAAILKSLADFLRQQGCQVTIEQETAKHAGFQDLATLDVAGIAQHCNLALVLGGDGTMLGFGRQLAPHGVPLFDLPLEYLCWFEKKGWPQGRIGELLRVLHQLKTDGCDEIFDRFRRARGGRTSLRER